MATMISTHYAHQPQHMHYGYAPPPSPPMEEPKCSLPSISNLLGLADQGSPTSETSPQSHQSQSSKSDTRPNSSHYGNMNPAISRALPPSPPMSSDASFEGYNSPSTKSISQLSTTSNYYFESTPPLSQMEAEARQMAAAVPRVPVQASAYQPHYAATAYMSQPAMASYYPPMQPTPPPQPQMSGLYYQRPLPQVRSTSSSRYADMRFSDNWFQSFPPMPVSVALAPASGANPWQHHHYIAPSTAASFPQSQDRYICQTCNKAFSRPSSLRIHSHSHTGEKPFKCPHAGCGKAFSVRSNMKRHERGCHSFESSSSGSALSS
ncbi:hypothetical protein QBC37DRAFT_167976 [Rhypophila decipiens]|uniref:C2H2-type domain-containing protein n=1 Tax=Rhypophila decipiens TaxID=261697 RepID=A0AAN6YGX2_9PEZI|nr:hypothetical protein QBC37DRAFT_167976 [Rhypophila decipiens]